MSKFDWIFSKA